MIPKLEMGRTDLQLSKSSLRIPLRPLDRFLDEFEVWSKSPKNRKICDFLGKIVKIHNFQISLRIDQKVGEQ